MLGLYRGVLPPILGITPWVVTRDERGIEGFGLLTLISLGDSIWLSCCGFRLAACLRSFSGVTIWESVLFGLSTPRWVQLPSESHSDSHSNSIYDLSTFLVMPTARTRTPLDLGNLPSRLHLRHPRHRPHGPHGTHQGHDPNAQLPLQDHRLRIRRRLERRRHVVAFPRDHSDAS